MYDFERSLDRFLGRIVGWMIGWLLVLLLPVFALWLFTTQASLGLKFLAAAVAIVWVLGKLSLGDASDVTTKKRWGWTWKEIALGRRASHAGDAQRDWQRRQADEYQLMLRRQQEQARRDKK